MAATNRSSPLVAGLAARLSELIRPGQRLLLAYSGGLDSCVLLHLLANLRGELGFDLHALHVHHGLSPNADDWARFCEEACAALDVPLRVAHVRVAADKGNGVEAAARRARYQALSETEADFIVLAHHQDDQAETLLLQLLRGAGVKGLAAMAVLDRERRLLRPLLDYSRSELQQYAVACNLDWIEDESNQDLRYDRNYLRHELLPLIETRFTGAKKVLARTAGHMAESAMLLDELAQIDAACSALSIRELRQRLPLGCLRRISQARARNLLRWWLSLQRLEMPSAARLADMLTQLLSAREDAVISIKLGNEAHIKRYRDSVYVDSHGDNQPFSLLWSGQPVLALPDGSRLHFEKGLGAGIACKRLNVDKLRVVSREGGERFKPHPQRPTRTLKHLLQEANMPPWERQRLPLVYLDDELAAVPGIGVAAGLHAEPQEMGLVVTWCRG